MEMKWSDHKRLFHVASNMREKIITAIQKSKAKELFFLDSSTFYINFKSTLPIHIYSINKEYNQNGIN